MCVCVCVCVCVCAFRCFRPVFLGLYWVLLGSLLVSVDEESPDKARTPLIYGGDKTNKQVQEGHSLIVRSGFRRTR